MLVETWILIVLNCSANREHFNFLGRIAKMSFNHDIPSANNGMG